jgi:hypothetical protein
MWLCVVVWSNANTCIGKRDIIRWHPCTTVEPRVRLARLLVPCVAPICSRPSDVAAIVVYDLTNKDSFDRAKQWVKELQRQGNPNIVIALAGNKSDIAEKRQVPAAVCYPSKTNRDDMLYTPRSLHLSTHVKTGRSRVCRRKRTSFL